MPPGFPTVVLAKALERAVREGIPWLWRKSIAGQAGVAHGGVVDVITHDGRFIARGLYDAKSEIAVRIVTLDPAEVPDARLVRRRLEQALRARSGVFDAAETNAWRCVNGEGDLLPGVVIDIYAEVAVLRLEGPAEVAWQDWVVAAARELLAVRHVLLRERQGKATALHGGLPDNPVEIRECGTRFLVDVLRGQKTGFFLDQRENRRLLRWYAAGHTVANLFGYTGGFSVQAVLAGAKHVTTVDTAAPALELAQENFRRNGIDPGRHAFVRADCFEWLEDERMAERSYGVMVVDPPSFAPSEATLGPALEAYRKLNAAALAVTAPEGLLATSSCSSHVSQERFLEVLARAATGAGRPIRLLEVRGQPGDHPSLPAWPEGRYLEFVIARAI